MPTGAGDVNGSAVTGAGGACDNIRPMNSLSQQLRAFDYVFWICILMELMERMAYYGVRLVVPVFMVLAQSEGGAGLSHTEKGTILACWAAMQSWLPTFAGGFSDRFGYKRTIAVSVFLKTAGYLCMAQAGDFWGMFVATQLLAAGTGLFKPGIQGTMAHSIAKSPGSSSMGWGLFYQSVNVGAAVSAYIPVYTRDIHGWPSLFYACSLMVCFNLVPLFFYKDPVDERQKEQDQRGVFALVAESVATLFTSPRLMAFVLISAGFWFSFHQLFDMLPNYVDDWTDSSVLLRDLGGALGIQSWVEAGNAGEQVPQERLLNINALMIMFTMFVFAWLSSKLRVLTSTMVGMLLATSAFLLFVWTANVYAVLAGVVIFTVGEMLSSPKRQEYLASLAPPGKRALFLGYSNMPDGIGWVLGSVVAGSAYEDHGDKVNLCRRWLAEQTVDPGVARGWVEQAAVLVGKLGELEGEAATTALSGSGWSAGALRELVAGAREALKLGDSVPASEVLQKLAEAPELPRLLVELVPRAEVLDYALTAVPQLPGGLQATDDSLRTLLYSTYDPGQVWWTFIAISGASVIGMFVYDHWVRRNPAPAE
ncbi:MAG TPA: MFS transporter [Myxococcota bacterium]|nr:MFS transporter [Myxococcota bacterium]